MDFTLLQSKIGEKVSANFESYVASSELAELLVSQGVVSSPEIMIVVKGVYLAGSRDSAVLLKKMFSDHKLVRKLLGLR